VFDESETSAERGLDAQCIHRLPHVGEQLALKSDGPTRLVGDAPAELLEPVAVMSQGSTNRTQDGGDMVDLPFGPGTYGPCLLGDQTPGGVDPSGVVRHRAD